MFYFFNDRKRIEHVIKAYKGPSWPRGLNDPGPNGEKPRVFLVKKKD